jgi:hypothetical protein
MNISTRILILLVSSVCSVLAADPLPRSEPESEGLSSSELLEFVDALDNKIEGIHSVMIMRHGKVVVEGWWVPYSAGSNHVL